jgi:hypothetical protein
MTITLLVRRQRRYIYAGIAGCAAAATARVMLVTLTPRRSLWHLLAVPLVASATLTALLIFVIIARTTGRSGQRTTELHRSGGSLLAPMTTNRDSNRLPTMTGYFAMMTVLDVPELYRQRDDLAISFPFTAIYIAGFLIGALLLVRAVKRGSQQVRLTPEGLHVPRTLGSRLLPWTEIHHRGATFSNARKHPVTVRFGVPTQEVTLYPRVVDSQFLATAICYYTELPAERAEIGTDAGYERLRNALGIARPSHSPQPTASTLRSSAG